MTRQSIFGAMPARLAVAALLCVSAATYAHGSVQAHRATDVKSAYMTTDEACNAAVSGASGQPPAQTSFPTQQSTVCLVVLGSFQDTDQLNGTIFDSQGRVAWHTGPGTVTNQFGGGSSQYTGLVYPGLQYGLAITASWPDGQYTTQVNFNGPVVQTISWSVGTVPATNTAVPTPITIGATNTPAPTNTAPPPPTATSVPVRAASPSPTSAPVHAASPTATSTPTAQPSPTNPSNCTGSVPNVVRCAKKSVLLIAGQIKGSEYSTGSGFVVRSDATGTYLVTNLHVVWGTKKVLVDDPYTRHLYNAEVVATNKAKLGSAGDLAVIRVKSLTLPVLHWGNSDSLVEGDTVISIGYPGRDVFNIYDTPTITDGIVSALHRDEQDGYGGVWIQHQSIINHGNSGGPLLDLNGHVVGVNTLGIDQLPSVTGKGTEPVQGIFYAIPSNLARTVTNKLIAQIAGGTVSPPAAQPTPPPAAPSTASYKGKGYQLQLPGDWSAKTLKDGSSAFLSPDQAIVINAAVYPIQGGLSQTGAKKAIASIAAGFGKVVNGQPSIVYQPASIGPLSGISGLTTFTGTKETLDVIVVGDSQHALVVAVDIAPSATAQEKGQATKIVASIQLT